MSSISTHILDTARGLPAAGVVVQLDRLGAVATHVNDDVTDADGRVKALASHVAPGTYKITFATGRYHEEQGIQSPFFPAVEIIFHVTGDESHYHVPLLLSPYGYSTYRGS